MSDKIYAKNDDSLDIQKTLYYDNKILIYDEKYCNLIEISIGLCNIILNNVKYINKLNIDEFLIIKIIFQYLVI